ncbi:MAG TPA: hypothetical protein DDY39_19710 [Nitrospira sp.]|nr:hypothetical protein [Nitrospira sp.]
MICQELIFNVAFQPQGLLIQTVDPLLPGSFFTGFHRARPLPEQKQLDPVYDSERDRIGFPRILSPWWVVPDPISYEKVLVLKRTLRIMEIIEVMQVIPPEFRHVRARPI